MRIRNPLGLGILSLAVLSCATAYQPTGLSGGFEETKLGQSVFQVRFAGNGFSSHGRVASFLLRRCAELSLEEGSRYFLVESAEKHESYSGGSGYLYTFPSGEALIRLVYDDDSDPLAIDAILVIQETDSLAKGRVSVAAREAMIRLNPLGS